MQEERRAENSSNKRAQTPVDAALHRLLLFHERELMPLTENETAMNDANLFHPGADAKLSPSKAKGARRRGSKASPVKASPPGEPSPEALADAFAQSLRDLFADMDADGDGVLTKREVRDALADLGERDNRPGMRPHQIQKLFDAIDLDGDGEVTYAELVDFLVEQTEE